MTGFARIVVSGIRSSFFTKDLGNPTRGSAPSENVGYPLRKFERKKPLTRSEA